MNLTGLMLLVMGLGSGHIVTGCHHKSLKPCPSVPPNLVGPIKVSLAVPSMEGLEREYGWIVRGGRGRPAGCRARERVAIITPFRNRYPQLRTFLHNLHAFLTKQQLDYTIFIVEQVGNQTFNRAKLMNVGVVEADKVGHWDCYIFHDVDLLPENDHNLYSCPKQPRHMSVGIDKFHYTLPYASMFGGVSGLSREAFYRLNGFSNGFWGWGGEDDDMSTRIEINGFNITRYPIEIATYTMINHTHEKDNPVGECRWSLLSSTRQRWWKDGVRSVDYKLLSLTPHRLFTRILVDLLEEKSRKELSAEGICSSNDDIPLLGGRFQVLQNMSKVFHQN